MQSNFEQIYDKYYDYVYRYIFVSVKDKGNTEYIIEIVFTKIYKNRDKISKIESNQDWILSIVQKEIKDFNRCR